MPINHKVTSGKQAVESHIRHAMKQCQSVRRTAAQEFIDKIDQTIERLDQELRALRENLSEDVAAPHIQVTQSGLMEFCTTSDSPLGRKAEAYGIRVTRSTMNHIIMAWTIRTWNPLAEIEGENTIDLWGSIPCAPWSQYQHLCKSLYGKPYLKKLQAARRVSRKLLRNFCKLARATHGKGGRTAFEWPRDATGWQLSELQKLIIELRMYTIEFDGCAVGSKDSAGNPRLKRWRVVTTCPRLAASLARCRCKHEKGFKHAVIAGASAAQLRQRDILQKCAKWFAVHGSRA